MSPRLLLSLVVLLGLTGSASGAVASPRQANAAGEDAGDGSATPTGESPGGDGGTKKSSEAPKSGGEAEVPRETLRALLDSIQVRSNELESTRQARDAATDASEKSDLAAEVRRLEAEVTELRAKFESIVTGVDPRSLRAVEPVRFDLKDEISTLLEPVVRQLKEATAEPREIEQLRNELQIQEDRISMAERALANLKLRRSATEGETRAKIDELIVIWEQRMTEFRNQEQVAAYELQRRLEERSSLVESTGQFVNGFFRNRGANLLIALSSFLAVFLVLRYTRRRLLKLIFRRRATFYSRLASVVLQVLSLICAIAAMILALFSVSDWVLLVLVLVFFIGIGWASVNMLPQFFEQVRLLLNLGSVRENERIILEGLPWRVDELKIYTVLRNPDLQGGVYRIPIRDLVGLHSRPLAEDEVWFPSRPGDWVILDDGVRGRVVHQSPDVVQLVEPGGAHKTYQTQAFLGQNPRNLSTNYRMHVVFGIDYAHQAISTTSVPEIMKAALRSGLTGLIDEEAILNLSVEFREAGASSLDYSLIADLSGSTAARYDVIKRAISRFMVDTCNEHGWGIPFTQITVHQAANEQAA